MPATKEIFQRYMNPVFIETGTHKGDGVKLALDAGFKTIHSIELGDNLFSRCCYRFRGVNNVRLHLGDSADVLPIILEAINQPITFWLDGHYSGGDTALGKQNTPLLQELRAIAGHHIKTHTILIDDLRGWYKDTQGFDTLDLMKMILDINPDYKFTLENGFVLYDILVAKC